MISNNRQHQYALSLCHSLFHSHLITSSPFGKDLGSLNQNLYLSPFLSLFFGCFRNCVNSKFSLTLDGLLGSGSSLDCNCWNLWSEEGREWEVPGVKGGVWRISLYWTLSALNLLIMQQRSLVWRIHSVGVHLSPPPPQKHIVYNTYNYSKNNKYMLQKLQSLLQQFPKWWWAF